uniref:mitogen-activated protein kinase kinase kinase n=1 Tax=Anthurium amnicola TaxID=1678845 RepID=A0A1D1XXW5_9ARAE
MPSWWGKPSSRDVKKKTSKENLIDTIHRFISPTVQKGNTRLGGSRRCCNDTLSGKGSRSTAVSRSPSPSTHVSRCQSFADRPVAQPLPLPETRASDIVCKPPAVRVSSPILQKRGKPPLHLPLPTPDYITSRPDVIDIDGDLATPSVSSNCSIESDDPADSRLHSPVGADFENGSRLVRDNFSSVARKDRSSIIAHKNSRETAKPACTFLNNQTTSTSPKRGHMTTYQANVQTSRHGAFASAPDSSMSSPARSPMRVVFPEQIPTSAFWGAKPYNDVNLLGSGQCSSPGSGQTSGHNSMGGDMSGQLFWLHSRGSTECSPIPSPRMTSPGPSSRIHSGAVSPLHPCACGTAPESPKQRHRLPLPPTTNSNTSHFSSASLASNNPSPIPRSPGRPDNPPSPGSRWKKGRLIGRGTFGHVYVGFNSESGEMCAIKEVTLFSDDPKSKESAKQLGQEISLLSRLRHSNIVQYYGSETLDDKLYIYLEYVSGGSIHKLLQEYGRLGELAIRSYTQQILAGLAYLHTKNTVHRDIKGANILVDPNGRIKLADFGMAKHITGQSCPLSFKGSPYWMAPEVIKNANGCNLAVDIWSLGCTVLEMATSKPPWSQYEGIAAMFKIGNSKELPTIPDHLSDEGKGFIRQCLQREPSNRPTAVQLLQHPFVSNAGPLTRSIIDSEASEPPSGVSSAADFKGVGHARNLSFVDMQGLAIQRLKATKASSISSGCQLRNLSCPVSPIGSPLLSSWSPQHISGRMSPSPISSPRTTSGSSTPLTAGNSSIPFNQSKQSVQPHESLGNMPRTPNHTYVKGSACHDPRPELYRGMQPGSPVLRERVISETEVPTLPFGRSGYGDLEESCRGRLVLADHVSQQFLPDQVKPNPPLHLGLGSSVPVRTTGI